MIQLNKDMCSKVPFFYSVIVTRLWDWGGGATKKRVAGVGGHTTVKGSMWVDNEQNKTKT